ncbi:MAG: type VI secretion system baseplate subunit TssG [Bacteroidales bacterium]|nr:type VI secretion system baseplate subunit TssG [Bacteroidales bacterium]
MDSQNTLGKSALGIDFVCGRRTCSSAPVMEFTISPLRNTSVEDYLEHGQIHPFLECFFGYFVPVELDVKTTIPANPEYQDFTLDEEVKPVLGYSTVI